MSEPSSIRRLKKELIRYNDSLAEDTKRGVLRDYYYFPDSSNIGNGYVLIVGPKDTPYDGGFYVVKMMFGEQYPHAPPKCEYKPLCSIRQSPNLYEDGKVCLSVIGTWGESTYKSTMGFHQIIMSIVGSVMKENALDCEPPYDYSRSTADKLNNCRNYDDIVKYANFRYNVYEMYDTPPVPAEIVPLIREIISERIRLRIQWYIDVLVEAVATKNNNVLSCTVYPSTSDGVKLNYSAVLEKFIAFAKALKVPGDIDGMVSAARKKIVKATISTAPPPPPHHPPPPPPPHPPVPINNKKMEFKPALVGESIINQKTQSSVKIVINKPTTTATTTATATTTTAITATTTATTPAPTVVTATVTTKPSVVVLPPIGSAKPKITIKPK